MNPLQPVVPIYNLFLQPELAFTVLDQLLPADGSITHKELCTVRGLGLQNRQCRAVVQNYLGGTGNVRLQRALSLIQHFPDYMAAFNYLSQPHPPAQTLPPYDLVSETIVANCGGCLRILIEHGLNPRAYNQVGYSLLSYALAFQKVTVAGVLARHASRSLVLSPPCVEQAPDRHPTMLALAARPRDRGFFSTIYHTVSNPANHPPFDLSDEFEPESLADVVLFCNPQLADELRRNNVNIEEAFENEMGVWHYAVSNPDPVPLLEWLYENTKPQWDLNRADNIRDVTPLMRAAGRGTPSCVEWLLEHQANPNHMSSLTGVTAPWLAASRGSENGLAILRSLIQTINNINVGNGTLVGTLLHAAIYSVQRAYRLSEARRRRIPRRLYLNCRRRARQRANDMLDIILASHPDLLAQNSAGIIASDLARSYNLQQIASRLGVRRNRYPQRRRIPNRFAPS